MLSELANLIHTNSQIYIETLNTYQLFLSLPNTLECEKAIYCTSSSDHYVQNGYLNQATDNVGYLSLVDQHEPYNVKIVYCTTDVLLQRILFFLSRYKNDTSAPWFCSVIIMNICDVVDPNYQLIVQLLDYYRHINNTISPKTIFLGKCSYIPATITLRKKIAPIVFDDIYETKAKYHKYIVDVIGKYEGTVTVIVPDDKNIQQLASLMGSDLRSQTKLMTNDINNVAVFLPMRITICTSNTIQYVDESDIIIDMLLAPVKHPSLLNVCNEYRLVTRGEALSHWSGAKLLYLPLCSEGAFINLPTTMIEPCASEKQLLMLQYHGLSVEHVFPKQDVVKLKDYRLLTHRKLLTDLGHFCMRSPLGLRQSMIVYYLNSKKDPWILLHLCVLCMIETRSINLFKWPRATGNDTADFLAMHDRIAFYEAHFGGYSDVATLYNIWAALLKEGSPFCTHTVRLFCKRYHLNFFCFKNSLDLFKRCQYANSHKRFGMKICYSKRYSRITLDDSTKCSNELFRYLEIFMPECKATASYKHGKVALECGSHLYDINDKSVHTMHIGGMAKQPFYILSSKETIYKGIVLRSATLIHALPQDDMDSIISDY